ncbi:hypothetical protein AGMMS49579_23350 [Spirochaetia bacterium]|nr:hypothetical protein AGMMS49579_23350 [Spirochaetia bacterium]
MKIKYLLCCLFIMTINVDLFANDAFVNVAGGTVTIIGDIETNVQMESEIIKINMYDTYYEVDVLFNFYNPGKEEIINVGFPQYSTSPVFFQQEQENLYDFVTYINNEKVEAEFMPVERIYNPDIRNWEIISGWYIKKVTFPSNGTIETSVNYKTKYSPYGFGSMINYLYGTGISWNGPIGKMTIEIVNNTKDKWLTPRNLSIGNYSMERNSNKIIITAENIKPKTAYDTVDFIVQRTIYFYPHDYSFFWDYLDEHIYTEKELLLLTDWQLCVLRNAVYAYHNYQFKTNELNELFYDDKNRRYNIYSSLPYKGIKEDDYKKIPFSESSLNEIEKKNVTNISNEEERRRNNR